MGVGELASFDERGRITIPVEIRNIVGKKDFKISLIDKDTIMLKAVEKPEELIKRIEEIELTGDLDRSGVDFQSGKSKFRVSTLRIFAADILAYALYDDSLAHEASWSHLRGLIEGGLSVSVTPATFLRLIIHFSGFTG